MFRSNINHCIATKLFEMYNDTESDDIYVSIKLRNKLIDDFILKGKEYREVIY